MVYGAGTIGLGVIAALRSKGVTDIIASDVVDKRLEIAQKMGATAFNPTRGSLMKYVRQKWGELPDNLGTRLPGVADMVTVSYPLAEAPEAFEAAMDKDKNVKVILTMTDKS